jgi:SAM-dependent methyltransferase
MVENVANAGAVESALGTPWCPVTASAAAEHLLGAVEPAPGTLFLDLVAGLGHCAGLAARRGAIATGIDHCDQRLAEALRNYPQALFYTGKPDSLVFADGFFSAITHHAGPGQVPSPAALAEAFRVLVPGGRHAALCLGTPATPDKLGSEQQTPSGGHGDSGTALCASWEAVGFEQVRVTVVHIDAQADGCQERTAVTTPIAGPTAGHAPGFAGAAPPPLRWTALLVSGSKSQNGSGWSPRWSPQ